MRRVYRARRAPRSEVRDRLQAEEVVVELVARATFLEEQAEFGPQREAREHGEAQAEDVGDDRLVVEVLIGEIDRDINAVHDPGDGEVRVVVVKPVLKDEARQPGLLAPPQRLRDLGVAADHPPVGEQRLKARRDRDRLIDAVDQLRAQVRQRERALERFVEVQVDVPADAPGRRLLAVDVGAGRVGVNDDALWVRAPDERAAEVQRRHRPELNAGEDRLVAVVVGRDPEHRAVGARDLDVSQRPLADLIDLADGAVAVEDVGRARLRARIGVDDPEVDLDRPRADPALTEGRLPLEADPGVDPAARVNPPRAHRERARDEPAHGRVV